MCKSVKIKRTIAGAANHWSNHVIVRSAKCYFCAGGKGIQRAFQRDGYDEDGCGRNGRVVDTDPAFALSVI
jgi:hypothetical protein